MEYWVFPILENIAISGKNIHGKVVKIDSKTRDPDTDVMSIKNRYIIPILQYSMGMV